MGVAFDTLKFVEKLEGGGFSHAQAKAAAEAFADATGEQLATKADLREFAAATKADLREFTAATKADILRLEASTKADILRSEAATRAEIVRLEAKIETSSANLKVEILRWLVVTQIALAGFIFAAIKFVK